MNRYFATYSCERLLYNIQAYTEAVYRVIAAENILKMLLRCWSYRMPTPLSSIFMVAFSSVILTVTSTFDFAARDSGILPRWK